MRVFALVVLLLVSLPGLASAKRIALIIGNSEYGTFGQLKNTFNDASDIADALRTLDFEVELAFNLGYNELRLKLRDFQRNGETADVSMIYFAGHGLQIDERNYLIPVDATMEKPESVIFEGIPLDFLVSAVQTAGSLSLVVVDACRDNPFVNSSKIRSATRSLTRGLNIVGLGLSMVDPEPNTLVAYAAMDGTIALDGEGRNSPYAEAFLDKLAEPRLEISAFFRAVRDQVIETTNGQQEPFLYGSLSAENNGFFFNDSPVEPATPRPEEPAVASIDMNELEASMWGKIHASEDPADFTIFLEAFPDGRFAPFAERQIAALAEAAQAPADADQAPQAALGTQRVVVLPELAADTREDFAARNAMSDFSSLSVPNSEPDALRPDLGLTGPDLVRAIQSRLKELGCNPGLADGQWGPRSRSALQKFQDAAEVTLATAEPNIEMLGELLNQDGRVCPLECGPRYNVQGETCVLKTCVPGQRLSKRGTCYTPRPASADVAPDAAKPDVPACTVYNGIRLCS